MLERGVLATIAASVLAVASVHPWAYVPLWGVSVLLALLTARLNADVRRLRRRVGPRALVVWPGGRRLRFGAATSEEINAGAWPIDLSVRRPRPPLRLPGLVFVAWCLLQLVSWRPAGVPGSVVPEDTMLGIAFVVSMLLLHEAAAAAFHDRRAHDVLRRFLTWLGGLLAVEGLAQRATGSGLIYGFYAPEEKSTETFGPFVNRNHFAGYMLLVTPVALAHAAEGYDRLRARLGSTSLSRVALSLDTPEGSALVRKALLALSTVAALLATQSRGAVCALLVGLLVTMLAARGRVRAGAVGLGLVAGSLVMATMGLERIEARFSSAVEDAPARIEVWRDALSRMDGLWWAGTGFNTFGTAMSHVQPFTLPVGARPLPRWLQDATAAGESPGVRAIESVPGVRWYREAHDDYVQVLVETGVPGLAIALWGAAAVLYRSRRDPAAFLGLTAVLAHLVVDFDLQIPAVAALFCVVAAAPRPARGTGRPARPAVEPAIEPPPAPVV